MYFYVVPAICNDFFRFECYFYPKAGNLRQEATRQAFYSTSSPKLEIGARRLPESNFTAFLARSWKFAPGGFQKAILEHFWLQAGNWP